MGLEELLTRSVAAEGQPRSLFWSRADGRLHVQYYQAGAMVTFVPHVHAEYNIVISLDGAVETAQLGMVETVSSGEAMMGSHPGVMHSSRYLVGGTGNCAAVSLTFAPEVLRELTGDRGGDGRLQDVFLGRVQSPVVEAAAREIVGELQRPELAHDAVMKALATRILVEALRKWPRRAVEKLEADRSPRLARRDYIRACEFMRWCKKDAFRLERLCRYLGTSEERFTRLFRATTSNSPASFYNAMLLEQGRELLRDGRTSIKEVGYELGFKTPSHFVVAFRRQYGITPLEYRTTHLEAAGGGEKDGSRTPFLLA
jgi:AraC-like DNA-binding protein